MEVDHGNGLITTYNHLLAVATEKDRQVRVGQVIAEVGTTGSSTGCHLHFEVIENEVHTDPERWKLLSIRQIDQLVPGKMISFDPSAVRTVGWTIPFIPGKTYSEGLPTEPLIPSPPPSSPKPDCTTTPPPTGCTPQQDCTTTPPPTGCTPQQDCTTTPPPTGCQAPLASLLVDSRELMDFLVQAFASHALLPAKGQGGTSERTSASFSEGPAAAVASAFGRSSPP
ncbi:hypothetical protein GCM10009589_04880 [Arthrobacter pascens]